MIDNLEKIKIYQTQFLLEIYNRRRLGRLETGDGDLLPSLFKLLKNSESQVLFAKVNHFFGICSSRLEGNLQKTRMIFKFKMKLIKKQNF